MIQNAQQFSSDSKLLRDELGTDRDHELRNSGSRMLCGPKIDLQAMPAAKKSTPVSRSLGAKEI
ncbi:MAG: hypothetical protein CMM01_09320 [Rhodopirellula sp.]|nr:hypothetical protein [Rhodopirellula sp.]